MRHHLSPSPLRTLTSQALAMLQPPAPKGPTAHDVATLSIRGPVARLRDGRSVVQAHPSGGLLLVLRPPQAARRPHHRAAADIESALRAPSRPALGCDCTVADLADLVGEPHIGHPGLDSGEVVRVGVVSGAMFNFELVARGILCLGWAGEPERRVRVDLVTTSAGTTLRVRSDERLILVLAVKDERMAADPQVVAMEVEVGSIAGRAERAEEEQLVADSFSGLVEDIAHLRGDGAGEGMR